MAIKIILNLIIIGNCNYKIISYLISYWCRTGPAAVGDVGPVIACMFPSIEILDISFMGKCALDAPLEAKLECAGSILFSHIIVRAANRGVAPTKNSGVDADIGHLPRKARQTICVATAAVASVIEHGLMWTV